MNKLVSLLTPGWNGKQFVYRLLNSILEQTYRPIEYIYIDDGSTDGTDEIVLSYKNKFKEANIDFKFIKRDNGGICEALMTGFKLVKGEYMSCPEYDDILLPTSVEEKVKYLEEHPDCAVVVADAWIVNENDIKKKIGLISNKNPNRFDKNHFLQCLTSNTIFNAACYMVKMDLFDKTHPNRKIIPYQYGPNMQILLPLYYHYNRGFIENPLSIYIIRQNSLSNTSSISFEEELERAKQYRSLRINVLDQIKMPLSDLVLYKKIVDIKYNKHILNISYHNNDKVLFQQSFDFLSSINEITNNEISLQHNLNRRNTLPYYFILLLKRHIKTVARFINNYFK